MGNEVRKEIVKIIQSERRANRNHYKDSCTQFSKDSSASTSQRLTYAIGGLLGETDVETPRRTVSLGQMPGGFRHSEAVLPYFIPPCKRDISHKTCPTGKEDISVDDNIK